jgi:hypothetical protein
MDCENTSWIEIFQDRFQDGTVVWCDGREFLDKITTARDFS